MNFSMYIVSSPNALADSLCAILNWNSNSSADFATRIPFPPPPEDALIMTGYPISSASLIPVSASYTGSFVPGTTGTPASIIVLRAWDLFPMLSMTSAFGPIKVIPFFSQRRNKLRILRQEAESRMDRVCSHIKGCRHDAFHVEIAVPCRPLADTDPLVCKLYVKAVLVFL